MAALSGRAAFPSHGLRSRNRPLTSVSVVDYETSALDDDRERRGRVLLLGKGAVLAHRLARPLAAESDESEQRAGPGARDVCAAPSADSVSPLCAARATGGDKQIPRIKMLASPPQGASRASRFKARWSALPALPPRSGDR